jgi:hypothetical protein
MSCKYTYKSNIYTEAEIKDLILEQEILKNNPVITFTKKIFKTLPYQYKEDLLNEGSKKYGIKRGNSTATIKYSQVDQNKVDFGLKAIEILQSDKAKEIFKKGQKSGWDLNKILNELQVPKEQKQLILDLGKTNREEIITNLLANYSYAIEINTAKENHTDEGKDSEEHNNLNVPGGTNYKINVFKTPLIIPSIINHFFHKNQIGWFRSDDKENKIVGWKEEDDFLNSETAQYNPITKDDKIIWGHPAIGKSYAAKKVKMIDFDSYKIGINRKYNLYVAPGLSDTELRTDDKTREARENWRYENEENQALWNQFIRDAWQQAKQDAKQQGAILFASDLLVLREFGNEVDKALTMPDELFFQRSKQRNNYIEGPSGTKVWKGNLNKAVANFKEKFGRDKVINTDKYLSDLLEGNPKTRRILEVQSDLFQKGRDEENLVDNSNQQRDGVGSIPYSTTGRYAGLLDKIRQAANENMNNSPKEGTIVQVDDNSYIKKNGMWYPYTKDNQSENQFLQLLNKDNNWVTFFIKSIIADSAKKGYEKVLFPTSEVVSKIQKFDEAAEKYSNAISKLEKDRTGEDNFIISEWEKDSTKKTIKGTLDFYNNLRNTLDDLVGGNKNDREKGIYKLPQITDEYGNTWNEITITPKMSETIRLNTPNGKVEYTGDLAIEEKIAEEAYNSKDERIPTTLIGKFIQSIKNLFRNLFKEKDKTSRLIRDLNQGRFNLQNNQNGQGIRYSPNQSVKPRVEENPVRIFYQLAPDSTRKELNQELTRFVKDILNKMGISTRTFEEYLKDFNRKNPDQQMDMVAFSDMFNRIIAYNERTQDGTTLSEEMWHFIIDMMWDSPEVKEIRELKDEDGNLVFKKSGIWERESLDYYKIYSQTISNKKELDEKVEKEIIAKLLAQNLYDNFQGEEGFLGRFKMIIRNIYNKIIGRFIGKIRRANIKTKDVNDELNNILNKLNLQLRYGQLYDNVVTGSQNIKKTNNITKDNGDLEDRYKIPITKDLFSHRVLVVAIRTLKDKLQHLKDTKTGLYNEELNKNWNKYSKILKEHIGLTSFTDIHDLKTSLDEYQNGNPSEVNTEKGIMIEEAFNKMRQLIILSSEDRRKINEIASIQRRVTSLQKQYAANQFQFGIFAFFFGNDGEVEINNNQLNEDIKESSEGVITDLNKVLTRISEIQNDNLELTPVEFQKIVNAYSEYEPIIKRLNDIFNNGYNFNELTVEQNEKLKKTMDSLARYQLTDINDFLVNKSTAANLKEMERYALETNTMNPALEARIKSGNGNIGSIGIARLMFGSAVNSMEDWISMFSRKIMDIQNKVTRKSHDEAQELIGSIRDEISNANDSDMRSIMEQDENGVPTGYYINPYNVGKHSKAFEKAAKDIVDAMDVRAKKIGFTQGFPSNRDARHKMWSGHYLPNFDLKVFNALKTEILKYKKNEIPEQLAKRWEKIKAEKIAYDNGIANLALLKIEHDKLWANWFSKNTMPHPDAEQIINDRRKNMSESEYNLWYKKSVKIVKDMEGNEIGRYYKGELAIPSDGRVINVKTFNPYGELITTKVQTIDYKNPKYNSLSAKNKKIVDTLVKYKTKAALKLPINFTYEFAMRLPQRSASKSDISIGKKYVKENVKEWVSEFFDNKIDNQLFGEEINGVQIPRPRIQYVHKLDDPKLISQDLIMSTIMFMRMSINYEENMLAIPELEGMKQMAKYNKIKQNRDALIPDPNNIMEWVSKGASVISNFGTNENEDDKLIAKMQNMLNTHVYGIKYANPTETTRKLAPFLEKMRTYIRDLRLLGSAASAIKGMVSAIVDTMGVSFINRYFDKKDLTFGVKEYLKESHSRIYQSSSILKTTKSEVLADSLGLVGSLERNTANNTRTRVWRMITKSVDYGNYVSADRNIKYPIMIAISNTLRYYNGKLYSQKDFPGTKEEYNKAVTFWNSVSVENGRIKYKDYVKESDINYFTNMVKSVAARMDGQLMDIDRGAVYNNAFLQFLTINTQFLYQQLDLFFSGQRYDYLLQRNEAGYGGTIARNFDRIFLPGLSRSFDEMTDAEKDAAKQIYTFMVTALILNTLAFILIAGYVDDDKDKDPFWKFLTYISLGSAMEHLGRYSAEDVLRYILAPTQGGEEGKNALAALMQLITCAFVAEETVGANSMYEGYSKTDQSVIRSIPLVRGAFETWAGGYVNEVLNKPATSIATSYSGKTKLVRDKIYNENWGVGLTWPSRAGGNFIGNQIAKRLGYEYQWKNLIQLPIKKEKENKGKKDNNKKDK